MRLSVGKSDQQKHKMARKNRGKPNKATCTQQWRAQLGRDALNSGRHNRGETRILLSSCSSVTPRQARSSHYSTRKARPSASGRVISVPQNKAGSVNKNCCTAKNDILMSMCIARKQGWHWDTSSNRQQSKEDGMRQASG